MNLGNLRRVNLPASTLPIDEDREELRTRGKEFFSGRSINWEKLGVINRVRSRFSTDYMNKVQDEFKNYLKDKLVRKMNEFKTFTYNNDLDKVRDYVRGIKDLSGSDLKELLSLVDAKEVEIANEYFVKERDILINKLIERGCLTTEEAQAFISQHAEYQKITSRDAFGEFRAALYEKYAVPVGERE